MRDAHIAEDIFQNVALKALAKEVAFDSDGALMSWAFIAARREGIDWLRRQKMRRSAWTRPSSSCSRQSGPVNRLAKLEAEAAALRDWLSELPAESRELLKMRYFDGQRCGCSRIPQHQAGRHLQAALRLHQALKLHRDQAPGRRADIFQSHGFERRTTGTAPAILERGIVPG